MLASLLALTIAASTGTAAKPATAPATNADEAALRALDQLFETSFNKKDIAGLMQYYADDAVVMDPGPQLWVKGKEAIRASFTAMVSQPGSLELHLHDATYRTVGNLGYAVGLWTMKATGPDGKTAEMKGRMSAIYEKRDGKWLAIVDHASMPMPAAEPAKTQ
jgi:uncharacterized protein (TIGR02246 family)